MQSPNPLRASSAHGHSVWLDYNARRLLILNELERLVEQDGVPCVFCIRLRVLTP